MYRPSKRIISAGKAAAQYIDLVVSAGSVMICKEPETAFIVANTYGALHEWISIYKKSRTFESSQSRFESAVVATINAGLRVGRNAATAYTLEQITQTQYTNIKPDKLTFVIAVFEIERLSIRYNIKHKEPIINNR